MTLQTPTIQVPVPQCDLRDLERAIKIVHLAREGQKNERKHVHLVSPCEIERRTGKRLRDLREAQELTQLQFAKKAGLPALRVSRMERGMACTLTNLMLYSQGLGISLSCLFEPDL